MTNGFRRPVEHEIAEVGMSIQAPDVGLTKFHQYLVRGLRIAGVSQIIRLGDRIRVEIVGIHTRQDLLHFELRTRTTGDDRSGPVVDGFARLAPVLFPWVPNAAVLEFQRDEPEGQHIQSCRFDFPRQIGMTGVAPALARPDPDDLSRYHVPEPWRPKRNGPNAP